MVSQHPHFGITDRVSPKEAYTRLGISYSTLKNHTNAGRLIKKFRADGSPYYLGDMLNKYWESKAKVKTSCADTID